MAENKTIKQLASFAVIDVNGGHRVTYTYDEIDAESGDVISTNNKGNFYAVDEQLLEKIEAIRTFISEQKLKEA